MAKDALLSIRIPSDIKDGLQQLAEGEERTLSQYVERLLRAHVEAQKPARKPRR